MVNKKVVVLESKFEKESYDWEYRDVILEFLQSASASVTGKNDRDWQDWTIFEIDERKWWKTFAALMKKYAYADHRAVAILGHVAITFEGCDEIWYYASTVVD